MKAKIIEAEEVGSLIKDGATLCIGGAGAGHAVPDKLLEGLEKFYQSKGTPCGLTLIHPCGIGDNHTRGLNRLAQPGLIRRNIGGFWGNAPSLTEMALNNQLEAYNFPQGVLEHLMRAAAAKEDGLLTKTGLHTFVDPRYEGGKINSITKEDLVSVVQINGMDYLFFKTVPVDVALIRGTSVDKEGNLTMEEEVGTFSMFSMAQAAKVNGGIVIAQVKKITDGHAMPSQVKVPGIMIDYVVVDPEQKMTFITDYEQALVQRDTSYQEAELKLEGIKKIIARRTAFELNEGDRVNLGYGMPDGVPIVARQEDILDHITFMIEQGQIGGVITTGLNFGAMYNPTAIIDDGYQFDFFHGGGLDICFLGFAQIDAQGNVNASRFGGKLTGCGGFIDISQHTKKVVFCGGFAAKSEQELKDGRLNIRNPGKFKKFVKQVEQVTFNGKYAQQKAQEVMIVTERAVFRIVADGIQLTEIAPGVDLKRDILDMMDFKPLISNELKQMDQRIFGHSPLLLKENFIKLT
jgi:propionate CoA-transferase